ncbi:MAG TPA: right-handed parallel beta-helix repeat-containing protein [Phycisphaerae bacterium]|nr:right-handed parallel beta-helix repeat-containing protein [Phycisphaerae bacterium]HRY70737.1 right-handed parallel beta-helix repeat-containing protein [Phycisphaerae bacterium]HSA28771.1 right-handed parallel beta-helix repeat-containing protein [Phycisphaerae bacterium]
MRKVTWISAVVVAALAHAVAVVEGAVIHVDDDAPGDPGPGDPLVSDSAEDGSAEHPFDAIQEGINAAVSSDTVRVTDGTYIGTGNKDLDFAGRLIAVKSANGAATCTINCESQGRAFWFHSGETAAAVVDGFTITGSPGRIAGAGAGIAIWDGAPTVANCSFVGNVALIGGGGACISAPGSPTTVFANCRFIGNSVRSGGFGGGLYLEMGSVALVNCAFRENSAAWGGGVFLGRAATLTNCEFVRNSATYGGGLYFAESASLTNCTFVGNSAGLYGGGVTSWDISQAPCDLFAYNCTFAGNAAVGGRSLAANTAYADYYVHNSILWELDTTYFSNWASFDPSYCNVMGRGLRFPNIDADPLFVRAPSPGPDGVWGTADDDHGDLRLQPGSPCIDAARNTYVPADTFDLDGDGDTSERTPFDLDGHPRFLNDPDTADTGVPYPPNYPYVVDMGAYEFIPVIPGDFDHDGDVDGHDLDLLVACTSGPAILFGADCDAMDLDGDDDVDQSDFGIFQRCWSGANQPAEPNGAN